jgi:protein SCO1/2
MFGRPLILLLSYYGCDGTCPTMNMELAKVLAKVERLPSGHRLPGPDGVLRPAGFEQHRGRLPAPRREASRRSGTPAGGTQCLPWSRTMWLPLSAEVGFRFFWSDAAKAFLHPNVLVFVTPEGRVARYIYGTRMDARAIELALTEADWERIANSTAVFDIVTGACFSYNYEEGRYQLNYSLLAGVGSLVLGLSLMGLGAWGYRRRMGRLHE